MLMIPFYRTLPVRLLVAYRDLCKLNVRQDVNAGVHWRSQTETGVAYLALVVAAKLGDCVSRLLSLLLPHISSGTRPCQCRGCP